MPFSEKDIIKEVKDEFTYYTDEWREIYAEGDKDMCYVAGNPWDPQERQAREDANRPCMTWDEISQYTNQLINDPRQNKRSIKISPRGNGATDQTAEIRQNIIRTIEYNSHAQAAYTTGFQGAVERSYGFWRVNKRYRNPELAYGEKVTSRHFEQELCIERVPNPNCVVIHPDYQRMDASDMMGAFVIDKMRLRDYKRRWPKAKVQDFDPSWVHLAPGWINRESIQVAEYWKVTIDEITAYLIDTPKGPKIYKRLPKGVDRKNVLDERTIENRVVTQYFTNGIEVLEDPTEIEIPYIPIVPCFGKELWLTVGGGAKRNLLSLVRLARDPFMYYCFIRSQEAEEAALTPKVPFIGYVGQFATDQKTWQTMSKTPHAYVQADPVLDATGQSVLPLPERQPFTPNFQAYEVSAEAARRGIQAAMGINPLPTAAQRQNQKSGVALEKIESQEDKGSFHLIDNYNYSIELTGKILNAWIPFTYEEAGREEGIRMPDESYKMVKINAPFQENDKNGQPVQKMYDTRIGDHDETVSVGPSFESQRDEAADFANLLVQNLQSLVAGGVVPPPQAAKLISLVIKLKQLGPLGDEMADLIAPDAAQMQMQQQMQAGAQQLQLAQKTIQDLQTELQKLKLERAGKVIDNEYELQITKLNNDVKVLIANTNTMQQNLSERLQMFQEYWNETHNAAHEQAMQTAQQQHEKAQAESAQQVAQAQAVQEQNSANGPANNGPQGATP